MMVATLCGLFAVAGALQPRPSLVATIRCPKEMANRRGHPHAMSPDIPLTAVDPASVTVDPVVAAAALDVAKQHAQHRSIIDSVLSYLRLTPLFATLPPPPSWIVSVDTALQSDVLEAAWRFAGGDDWGTWINNLGALSTLAAFSMRDLLMLRYLSIAGQLCGITFCITREPPLWNPVFWQGIFLAVNVYNLATELYERFGSVTLNAEEIAVFERIFLPHGITPTQFQRLLGCAQWKTVGRGHVVAIEGAAASDERTSVQLTLVHSGMLEFKSAGKTISTRRALPTLRTGHPRATDFLGDFVGDTSFFECLKEADRASAHSQGAEWDAVAEPSDTCFVGRESDEGGRLVTIETSARVNRLLVWDGARLRETLLDDLDLRMRMVQVLAANIALKLEASQDQALGSPLQPVTWSAASAVR